MEQMIERLKELVERNYKPHVCDWTYERSEGNSFDCFDDGYTCGRSWLAYDIGEILGMELEEPDEPKDDDY